MRQYFKDSALNAEIEKKGFVVLPFLNNEELTALQSAFSNIPAEEITQFYASAHHPDVEFRKKMSELIKQNLHRALNEYMIDIDLLGGSYIAKPPKYEQVLQPHQDWNIVDESTFRSFNVWIPLVDLNQENGAIMVMPGSHRWIDTYRHSSIPCAFSAVHSLLLENMQTLYLKAGEALIYDHALIHASHENRSSEVRVACASGIKPKEADMLLYWNNNGTIEEYESNAAFFMTENVFAGPGNLVKKQTLEYDFKSVSADEFYTLCGIAAPKKVEPEVQIERTEDKLPFWKVYTPMNILREIKSRITG
jgi:hypothetical protein